MPRGRRPGPGTAEEKAALRRERVRLNVRAFRKRKRGADSNQDSENKSTLRWVSDSKWQAEYSKASDDSADDPEATASSSSSGNDSDLDEEALGFPMIPKGPDLARQYSFAMLATVPGRFLPYQISISTAPNAFINIRTPCALWVTSACNLAQISDSGPLKDSLLSIVLALAGDEHQRSDLTVASQRLYTRTLAKTRRTLQPIIDHNRIPPGTDLLSVFLACHASSVFELLINRSLENMARHVVGIGLLIQHLQSSSKISGLESVIGNSLLEEYRMLQMGFCLLHRRPTTFYLNRRNLNWPTKQSKGVSMFTDLLDLADQIPPIMAELDELRLKQDTAPFLTTERLRKLVSTLLNVHSQLQGWSGLFRGNIVEKFRGPIFDPADSTLNPAEVTSYEFAATWMFACSYDCYAIETCIEAITALADVERDNGGKERPPAAKQRLAALRSRLISVSGGIVEIQPYFMQDDKGIIGRSIAIWPLEAAWSSLENEAKRLQTDELELERDGGDLDSKLRVQETKVKVTRYLRMCRDTETIAKSYGLPMFSER